MAENRTKLDEHLEAELMQLGYKYQNYLMEWIHVKHIIEKELLPKISNIYQDKIDELRSKNKKLKAELNQLTFSNDPERDQKIVELYKLGLSNGKIAKEVGMSKWGVSKALRRLGVN